MTAPDDHPIGTRLREASILAIVTGTVTGLAVALFDRAVRDETFDRILDAPLWVQAISPAVGLTIAALILRWWGKGTTPSTADEYIRNFHDAEQRLDLGLAGPRLTASAATLGGGAAMGFEGPSIYMGAVAGSWLQRTFSRFFGRSDSKMLLVCGAAAGVAAIFKAPATGVVFALEVPYRQDLARRMLLPAMFAAAASYVVFAAINGTNPLFPISGAPPFDLRDLGGAALLGLACGGCARLFAIGLRSAKHVAVRAPAWLRLLVATISLVLVFVACRALTGESLVIGPGYNAIAWSLEPGHAIGTVLAIFLLRAAATTIAVGGGGVGGLFIPLVVQGAVMGSAMNLVVHAEGDMTLFPLLGVAAFLGAGYRVPLAAVVFVAETTGRPAFVVPALIAAATSQVLMGRQSVSEYQQDTRTGALERRLAQPVTAALRTDVAVVPPDATVAELYDHHVLELRQRIVPVVDGATYWGMVALDDVVQLPRDEWTSTPVSRVVREDWPTADVRWTLAEAVGAMEAGDVDRLPVLDGEMFVGLVTTGEVLKLGAIIDTVNERKP